MAATSMTIGRQNGAAAFHRSTGPSYMVFGAGLSGLAAARLLRAQGKSVLLLDESAPARLDTMLGWMGNLGIKYQFGNWDPSLLDGIATLVLSPGIASTHPLPALAAARGIPVIGELELGSAFAEPPIFAITGTNGKTTTTALISHILTECGFDAPSCGNIGRAFCDTLLEKRESSKTGSTILVTEVSSYQLETIHAFHPAAAWLLNITPDHLERHGGMSGYQEAKFQITKNQTPDDALAVNADDERARALKRLSRAKVWEFSATGPVERGAFLDGGTLMMTTGVEPFPLIRVAEIPLRGKHNIENTLAASLAMFFCDLDAQSVANAIRSFPGVEHRLEFVLEHQGVRYFNDSKATNVDALAVALDAFTDPLLLIAGGQETGADFTALRPLVEKRVRRAILIGETAERLQADWGETVECCRAESMQEAALLATRQAKRGDVVLLSPGCKSFDMFDNFEHRGRVFKKTLFDHLMGVDA